MGFADIQLSPGPIHLQPTVSAILGQELDVVVTILDEDGNPVDLTQYEPPYPDTDAEAPCRLRNVPITTGMLFTVRAHRCQEPPALRREVFAYGDPCNGQVTIPLEVCDFTFPGLYLGEIGLFVDAAMQTAYSLYLEVVPSLQWQGTTEGPLTLAEVRLWMRDNSPEDNFLLDEVEFKDTEVMAAIRRAIDIWNSTPPMMARYTYNTTNFPFRSQWIDLTIALLKSIGYHWNLRNQLQYSAGGISIDDRARWKAYLEESKMAMKEYNEWAQMTKRQLNAGQAYSRLGYMYLP